jgi:VWFA-related protein
MATGLSRRTALMLMGGLGLRADDASPTFRSGVSLVRIDVEVTQARRSVMGLQRRDFLAIDDGVRQTISQVSQSSGSLDLVLLFDASRSMKPHVEKISASARAALSRLKRGDRVAIQAFTVDSQLILPLTSNMDEVAQAIEQRVLSKDFYGPTALQPAVLYTTRAFAGDTRDGQRAVVVITDNQGNGVRLRDKVVLERLWAEEIVVSAIVVTPELEPTWWWKLHNPQYGIDGLIEKSGGDQIRTDDPGKALEETLERLRNRYSVYYPLPSGVPGKLHSVRIELTPEAKAKWSGAEVRARKGYMMPAATQRQRSVPAGDVTRAAAS